MSTREIHQDFIRLNWDALLDGSLLGYQRQGRGALVANVCEWLEFNQTPLAPVPYFPDRDTEWPMPEIKRFIEQYEPEEKEIVIVFLCPIDVLVCYRVSDSIISDVAGILGN